MNSIEKTTLFLATGFFIGKIPIAPGTFGSLLGIVFYFPFEDRGIAAAISGIAFLVPCAIFISHEAANILKDKDPKSVVIDEIVGMFTALAGIEFNLFSVTAGFLLFRFFDILKPFPVGYIDKKIHGGFGIVLDDIAAGIMANIVLRALLFYI